MKTYITFRSSVPPHAADMKGEQMLTRLGRAEAILLSDFLSSDFKIRGKPRKYYPIGCWGFPLTVRNVHVLVLLESGQETAGKEPRDVQITLIAYRWLFIDLFLSKKISTAVSVVVAAIERWVAADERLSEFNRGDTDQMIQLDARPPRCDR